MQRNDRALRNPQRRNSRIKTSARLRPGAQAPAHRRSDVADVNRAAHRLAPGGRNVVAAFQPRQPTQSILSRPPRRRRAIGRETILPPAAIQPPLVLAKLTRPSSATCSMQQGHVAGAGVPLIAFGAFVALDRRLVTPCASRPSTAARDGHLSRREPVSLDVGPLFRASPCMQITSPLDTRAYRTRRVLSGSALCGSICGTAMCWAAGSSGLRMEGAVSAQPDSISPDLLQPSRHVQPVQAVQLSIQPLRPGLYEAGTLVYRVSVERPSA